jgi:hypothetical protein
MTIPANTQTNTYLIGEPIDRHSQLKMHEDDAISMFRTTFKFSGFGYVPENGQALIRQNNNIWGNVKPVFPNNEIELLNANLIPARPILGINAHEIADEDYRIIPKFVQPICLLMRALKYPLVFFIQLEKLKGQAAWEDLSRKVLTRLIKGDSKSRGFDREAAEYGFSDCYVSNAIYSQILSWQMLVMSARKYGYYLPTTFFYGRLYDGTLPGLIQQYDITDIIRHSQISKESAK